MHMLTRILVLKSCVCRCAGSESNAWTLQVSKEQFEKILSYIDKGQQEGAKLEYGGKRIGTDPEDQFFFFIFFSFVPEPQASVIMYNFVCQPGKILQFRGGVDSNVG